MPACLPTFPLTLARNGGGGGGEGEGGLETGAASGRGPVPDLGLRPVTHTSPPGPLSSWPTAP